MANSAESGNRRVMTAHAVAFAPKRMGASVQRWLHLWRWPVALLVGIVLWLALVAVAGAAMRSHGPSFIGHEPSLFAHGLVRGAAQEIADKAQ